MTTTTICADQTEAAELLAEAALDMAAQVTAWNILTRSVPGHLPWIATEARDIATTAARAARHLGQLSLAARAGRLDVAVGEAYIDAARLMHDHLEGARRLMNGVIR